MRRSSSFLFSIAFVASLSWGCRDDDKNNNNTNHNLNNNNAVTTDDTIYQVQDPSHAQHLLPGDVVELESVLVSAVDLYGDRTGNVWVQEPAGGPYSGVQVFNPTVVGGVTADLSVGTLVTVRGEIEEFALDTDTSGRTVTEIVNGSVEILGVGTPPTPASVGAQEIMADPTAEQWEGVLVSLQNVRATAKSENYGEVTFLGGAIADDDLFDVYSHVEIGTCYGQVTGVLNYFFKYFMLPRSANDVVASANDSDCEQTTAEICDDDQDNDGDGWIDCEDWDCQDDPVCREQICDDDVDNDGDGDTDCDDTDCIGTTACPAQVENTNELCSDLQDNDGDNLVDCEDPSCSGHPDVTVCREMICTDNIDNDNDGFTDCDDWDCAGDATCLESNCTDNIDNDEDGFSDCADRDCWSNPACDAVEEVGQAECTDGVDNDEDGFIDCKDFSCQHTYAGCVETNCSDGIDNDNDGYTDCQDFDCRKTPGACPGYEADVVSCSDGLDNDADGRVDCDDWECRCCADNGCTWSYKTAVATCPRCTD
ncbi:MAG: hypothetical protein RBU30_06345 [Polyangia bacterium]|jgi:hypothetical protein|nr:hypothetical protein [Polyangia bacterium]